MDMEKEIYRSEMFLITEAEVVHENSLTGEDVHYKQVTFKAAHTGNHVVIPSERGTLDCVFALVDAMFTAKEEHKL